MQTKLIFSQEDSPVNHTAVQENALAKKMNAIYGPKCLEQYERLNQGTSWGRTFLGSLVGMGGVVFDEVHAQLEFEGYEVQAVVIPAAAVNAPHGRDRVWFVATNTNGNGLHQCNSNDEINSSQRGGYAFNDVKSFYYTKSTIKHPLRFGQKRGSYKAIKKTTIGDESCKSDARRFESTDWENFPTQSPICGGDDGLPTELDGITFSKWRQEAVKAYGNAIVPQVALQIFKAIIDTEK